MPEGLHVRVYHEDLMKNYPQMWDDNDALATWVRLFVIADKLWPSPGELPRGVGRAALKKLTDVGLVVLLPNHRYTCRGLDADRQRRRDAASKAANIKHHGNPDGSADGDAGRTPDGSAGRTPPRSASALPHTDTGARPRSAPASVSGSAPTEENGNLRARDGDHGEADAFETWMRLTGSWPSDRIRPWLSQLISDHGDESVSDAVALEWTADPTRHTVLGRVRDRLERSAHEKSKRRQVAQTKAAEEERRRIDSMPPEQRAANMARLREELEKRGLVQSQRSDA